MKKKHLSHIYIKKTTKEEVFLFWNEQLVRKSELEELRKYIIEEKEQMVLEYLQTL